MGGREKLRELHDAYVWELNAAVGAGRLDLVRELADQYFDEALELITGGEQATCGRTDCAVCAGSRPAGTTSRFRRRTTWRGAARRRPG
ncbi:hypothetical protein GCM10009844_32680 [Nocardioides koreensis]|uniref:FCD domain-containing protein n=1 Tax=Nocardioides koreensis TaxID=433651 RepID=A0ABP5LT90_9ACTN